MLFLAVLSLSLMTLDHYWDSFAKARSNLSVVAAPIRYAVHVPIVWVQWLDGAFSKQGQLLKENAALRANQLILQAKLHELVEATKTTPQIKSVLNTHFSVGSRFSLAELLAVDVDSFAEQVVIDKGKPQGVYVGQPVFDGEGVFGQVIDVGPFTSLVMLLTDTHSAIPVQVQRNGIQAMAVGSGDGKHLTLLHVTDTADIAKGDQLITSGLGLRYPMGYPVGIVESVQHLAGQGFAAIKVVPTAHLQQSRQVLLVWPSRASLLPRVREQLQKSPLTLGADSEDASE